MPLNQTGNRIMTKKQAQASDISTEEKIKEAARIVFTKKGYSATRTRDIAEEAGINLALLNYYFRSKQKLFEQVMLEKVQLLFGHIVPVLNDTQSSLETKVEQIVTLYIDMISQNPDLPLFVLSEIRNHPVHFAESFELGQILRQSTFIKQLNERRPDIHPVHFLMNMLGMTLFPFIAKPVFQAIGLVDENQFTMIMRERKALIPSWTNAILNTL